MGFPERSSTSVDQRVDTKRVPKAWCHKGGQQGGTIWGATQRVSRKGVPQGGSPMVCTPTGLKQWVPSMGDIQAVSHKAGAPSLVYQGFPTTRTHKGVFQGESANGGRPRVSTSKVLQGGTQTGLSKGINQ
jgi:hypothetical protein